VQISHLLPNTTQFLQLAELAGIVLLAQHAVPDAQLEVILCKQVLKFHVQGRSSTAFFFHLNALRENSRQD